MSNDILGLFSVLHIHKHIHAHIFTCTHNYIHTNTFLPGLPKAVSEIKFKSGGK